MICLECSFATFLDPKSICYKTGGMKCARFDTLVGKYDICPKEERWSIATLDELARMREVWRKEKRTVVLTNGCFDLLHVGHLRSLEEAKRLGDILVVGINSDKSVRKLKGKGRPIFDESERAEVLSSIRWVDWVVIFDGSKATDLILALKPDIHAKGTDYTEKNVPERETVLSYGGRVAITGDPKDHSSSDILKRLNAR
jgi:D-glycero-beta-D-manno-heptose 1-phosphate adenylyltransferase